MLASTEKYGSADVRLGAARREAFDLANGHASASDPASDGEASLGIVDGEECASVTGGDAAFLEQVLDWLFELEQANGIGDRGAVFAGALGDLLLREVKFVDQALKGVRLLDRIEIFALEIFHQRHLERHFLRARRGRRREREAGPRAALRASGVRRRSAGSGRQFCGRRAAERCRWNESSERVRRALLRGSECAADRGSDQSDQYLFETGPQTVPEPLPSLPPSSRHCCRACWLNRWSQLLLRRRRRWCRYSVGSGSRISALNPLPNAFLGICDNLLGKLNVAFGAFTMYVVEHYWHAVAWRFCQAYISRNDGFEDLCTEKAAKIGGYLLRECGAVVVHREENAFDGERRIDGAAEAHQRVEKLGYAFEGQILALNRDQDGIAGCESIQSEKIERWRAIDQDVVVACLDACNEGS